MPIKIVEQTGSTMLSDLAGQGGALLVIGAFMVFGIALAFTPCVFPMYPILAGTVTRAGRQLSCQELSASL